MKHCQRLLFLRTSIFLILFFFYCFFVTPHLCWQSMTVRQQHRLKIIKDMFLMRLELMSSLTLRYFQIVSRMAPKTGVQSQVESYKRLKIKWYLMPPCLTLGIIRYRSRLQWNNPGNRVVPYPTPSCSSYWKESLWRTPWLQLTTLQYT